MKITDKHVSDEAINDILEGIDLLYRAESTPDKHTVAIQLALLELVQRRAEDRHREANG